ncbi:MAG TPA: aspartate aminotransferase family protein, partial [Actinomycetota bacterium]
ETATALVDGLIERFATRGIPATANRAQSLFSVAFSDKRVRDFADAKAADHERYARLFHHMLDHGVWLPPSGYELWTLGTEHGPAEVEHVLGAASSFEGFEG